VTKHAIKTEESGLGYGQRKLLIVGNQNGSDTHMAWRRLRASEQRLRFDFLSSGRKAHQRPEQFSRRTLVRWKSLLSGRPPPQLSTQRLAGPGGHKRTI